MRRDWLDNYRVLFEGLERIGKPGTRYLVVAGHQNLFYLSSYFESTLLEPSWLFYMRRRPGHSIRLPGKQVTSATMPLAYFYKGPHKPPSEMISDLQMVDPSETATFESGLKYYLEKLFGTDCHSLLYLCAHRNEGSFPSILEGVVKDMQRQPELTTLLIGNASS